MYKKTVILAEKPKQAKETYAPAFEIEKKERTHYVLKPCNTFPNGAILTWGIGHLVSLKMPKEYKKEWGKWNLANLPIVPERYEFKVTKDREFQFNAVKKLLNEADTVINACDPDREGSNIFYSILYFAGARNKKIKRLWINSNTVSAVKKGFDNLLNNEKDLLLFNEARTRQIGDWLVGINVSQLYTLLLQEKGLNTTLSVGRVQTPTVYMIYERQKEIENFVSKPFYELFAEFTHENGQYIGKAKIKEDLKENILEVLKQHGISELNYDNATIKDVQKELKYTKPPQLHSLSTLQVKANKKWKYNSSNVLKLVQSLYEKKLLTYPRTETVHITKGEYDYLKRNLEHYKNILNVSFDNNYNVTTRHVDDSKVQEHFAIIPSDDIPSKATVDALSPEERNIYTEVLKTTLAMFHSDYKYEETTIVTDIKGIDFFTKGKVEIEQGWKELFLDVKSQRNKGDEKTDSDKILPSVSKGDLAQSVMNIKEGHTSPPKPFTEGTIITAMQTAGKFVDDKEESEILKNVEGIGTVATRASILENIKDIGYIESKKNVLYVTDKGKILCEAIEGNLLSSPSMTAKWEAYLTKIGKQQGTQEKFLNSVVAFLNSLLDTAKKDIAKLENSINTINEKESVGTCPLCNEGMITDKGNFYGCSAYQRGCKFSLPKKIAKKTLSEANIRKLVHEGKSNLIKGFKSKRDNKFDAYLKLSDGKISFEFLNQK